jgi:hypothetical protein
MITNIIDIINNELINNNKIIFYLDNITTLNYLYNNLSCINIYYNSDTFFETFINKLVIKFKNIFNKIDYNFLKILTNIYIYDYKININFKKKYIKNEINELNNFYFNINYKNIVYFDLNNIENIISLEEYKNKYKKYLSLENLDNPYIIFDIVFYYLVSNLSFLELTIDKIIENLFLSFFEYNFKILLSCFFNFCPFSFD